MNRIRALFESGRTVFLPFMTAGLPDPAGSPDVFAAMAAAGADGFEVGIPYSDPLMDGPVIQRGSNAALAAGTTLERAFEVTAKVAAVTGKPLLAMTYANPVMRMGPEEFCRRVAEAGGDGLVIPDLPLEESAATRDAAQRHGLGLVLFVAPTSDDARLQAVAAADPLFIYGVADLGVTGERTEASGHATRLAQRVRALTTVPLVLGVGISTPAQAVALAPLADGLIVGSVLVRRVLEARSTSDAAMAAGALVAEFSTALKGNGSAGR